MIGMNQIIEGEVLREEHYEIISFFKEAVFDINDKMYTKKKFAEWRESIYDMIKAGFEFREIRECPVRFKLPKSKEIFELPLVNFITNLFIWEAYISLDIFDNMDERCILRAEALSDDELYGHFDDVIIEPNRYCVSNKKMNSTLDDIVYNLSRISTDFNMIMAISVNQESLMDLCETCPELYDLMTYELKEGLQPKEIERELDNLENRLVEVLSNNENALQPILLAKVGIKTKQMRESIGVVGTKPDLYGNTIPLPINSNVMITGFKTVGDYFIDTNGGRKALILNKTEMGPSGHFASIVVLLSSVLKFTDVEDCNTLYPIPILVEDMDMLKRFHNRNFKEDFTDTKYTILDARKDTHLIGKKIYVRSPITCACPPNKICRTCYGELHNINKDLNSPGTFSAIKLTMPVSQDILSSKHLLTTTSEEIKFNDEFARFFKLSGNYIVLNDDVYDCGDDKKLDGWKVQIQDDDLFKVSDDDENEYNHFVTKFNLYNTKTKEVVNINEAGDNSLFIDKDIFKSMRKKEGLREIPLNELQESVVFVVEIKNNELTKPLYDIMSLLDVGKNEHRRSVSSMVMEMCRLMKESRIGLQSVHPEMIIYALLRKKDNILERPDFSTYNEGSFDIITVKSALENNPSPIIGVSFQYLKRQLKKPRTYEKFSQSSLDPFFDKR